MFVKYIFSKCTLSLLYFFKNKKVIGVCVLLFLISGIAFAYDHKSLSSSLMLIAIEVLIFVLFLRLMHKNERKFGCFMLNKKTNKITLNSGKLKKKSKEDIINIVNNSLYEIKNYVKEYNIKELTCTTHRSMLISLFMVFENISYKIAKERISKIEEEHHYKDDIFNIKYKGSYIDASFAYLYPFADYKKRKMYNIKITTKTILERRKYDEFNCNVYYL